MAELDIYRLEGIELSEAVTASASVLGPASAALLTGRKHFRVTRAAEVTRAVDRHDVYEGRLFGGSGELRWQREIGGPPVAVLLLRDAAAHPPTGWEAAAHRTLAFHAEIEQRYLVWGKALQANGCDLKIGEARVGCFKLPLDALRVEQVETGTAIQLVAHELLGHADQTDPNTRVVEELLSHFAVGDETWPEGLS